MRRMAAPAVCGEGGAGRRSRTLARSSEWREEMKVGEERMENSGKV